MTVGPPETMSLAAEVGCQSALSRHVAGPVPGCQRNKRKCRPKTASGCCEPTLPPTATSAVAIRECPQYVCAVRRRRFPVGASPTRQTLQPEATGAVMEVTKWLKPSV